MERKRYIRQHSADGWQTGSRIQSGNPTGAARVTAIPVFHERSGFVDWPTAKDPVGRPTTVHRHASVDPEEIQFSKQSGVTRIPAARIRRHSVQFGESGSLCFRDSSRRPYSARDTYTRSRSRDRISLDSWQDGQQTAPPGGAKGSIFERNVDRSLGYNYPTASSATTATSGVSDIVPVDLTSVQSDNSSHIICYKSGGKGKSRQPEMGVMAADGQTTFEPSYGHVNDRRQSSTSSVNLTDDNKPTYVKRNIHVRRHSVSSPSALRQKPKPKLLQDFQDWTGHQPSSPEVVSNESGTLVPVRRYSVTYAPKPEASDSDSGFPSEQEADRHKSQKRHSARRRCRPLSIVNESVSPVSVDVDEFDSGVLTDDSAKSGDVIAAKGPTAVKIESEQGNVNIVAAGGVNISLNTDKPLSVVGRSAPDKSSQFALWTEGTDLSRIRGLLEKASPVDQDQSPLGVWRDGNLIVDGLRSPRRQDGGQPNQLPFFGPPAVPVVQPIPMIYHPYLNPELRAGYQQPPAKNKSIYSPLSVDTNQQQGVNFLPFPVPRPVFNPGQGLLRTAANSPLRRSNVSSAAPRKSNEYPKVIAGKPLLAGASDEGAARSQDRDQEVVSQADEPSPPPQIDVKEMIADFESKSDTKTVVPEFGAAFGSTKWSGSRRASRDTGTETDTSEQGFPDGRYKLEVESGDKWTSTDSEAETDPVTLHAYIAEMSISECKYDNNKAATVTT